MAIFKKKNYSMQSPFEWVEKKDKIEKSAELNLIRQRQIERTPSKLHRQRLVRQLEFEQFQKAETKQPVVVKWKKDKSEKKVLSKKEKVEKDRKDYKIVLNDKIEQIMKFETENAKKQQITVLEMQMQESVFVVEEEESKMSEQDFPEVDLDDLLREDPFDATPKSARGMKRGSFRKSRKIIQSELIIQQDSGLL